MQQVPSTVAWIGADAEEYVAIWTHCRRCRAVVGNAGVVAFAWTSRLDSFLGRQLGAVQPQKMGVEGRWPFPRHVKYTAVFTKSRRAVVRVATDPGIPRSRARQHI